MRNLIILVSVFSLLFSNALSQEIIDTIYTNSGKIIGIGERIYGQKHGGWITYYENSRIESKGSYEKDDRVGKWIWYHDNGMIWSKEKYKNDMLIKGKFWDMEGRRSDISEVKTNPEYPGGLDSFRQMVAENLQYPEEARKSFVQCRVYVRFVINQKGELVKSKVIKGVHPDLDKEALRVVRLSELWKPGVIHGETINVSYTFPVNFVLE